MKTKRLKILLILLIVILIGLLSGKYVFSKTVISVQTVERVITKNGTSIVVQNDKPAEVKTETKIVEVPKTVEKIVTKEVIKEIAKKACADGYFTLANAMVDIQNARTLEYAQSKASVYSSYLDYYGTNCL